MSKTRIELRARPILRYIVTEHTEYYSADTGKMESTCVQLGEYANAAQANVAANCFSTHNIPEGIYVIVEECDQYELDWSRMPKALAQVAERMKWFIRKCHI